MTPGSASDGQQDRISNSAAPVVRCWPCRTAAHDFCERILDPTDNACMCNHDPARDGTNP